MGDLVFNGGLSQSRCTNPAIFERQYYVQANLECGSETNSECPVPNSRSPIQISCQIHRPERHYK